MNVKFITDVILNFSTATNVEIEIPVPPDATNPNVRTSMGSATYAPENDSLIWKIKSFPGGKVGIFLG